MKDKKKVLDRIRKRITPEQREFVKIKLNEKKHNTRRQERISFSSYNKLSGTEGNNSNE